MAKPRAANFVRLASIIYSTEHDTPNSQIYTYLIYSPLQNLSDPSLPYTGCILVPFGTLASKDAANDNGSCTSVLSNECLQEIISTVNGTAAGLSGSSRLAFSDCSQLLGTIGTPTSKCANLWPAGFGSAGFLPKTFTSPPLITAAVLW